MSTAVYAGLSDTEIYAELGDPIRGPSALAGDARRFWNLAYTIARTDFKLRFYGSALGYVWQLVRPLMMFGVLDLVYSLGKLGTIPHYPAMLLSGVVMFTFFTEATAGAVRCVVDRENFVRKIQFPRLAIPVAVVLTACFNLCVNFFAVAVFTFVDGVKPRLQWLELPLILMMLLVLAVGAAMLLSALFVRFRDIQPIWDVVCQVLFYASLILIPLEKIEMHGGRILGIPLSHIWMLNPLADVMQQYRHALLGPLPTVVQANGIRINGSVSSAAAIGGYIELLIPIGLVVVVFALGFWVFNRSAPHIAENL
jgi:ABC-2 type transport system permease protein